MSNFITPAAFDADRWTVGNMAHLINALDGAEVIIEVDKRTGHAAQGTLIATFDGGPVRGKCVTVKTPHNTTNYNLLTVGTIVSLHDDLAKWEAISAHSKQRMAAINTAKTLHGETRQWGKWDATPLNSSEVFVTYTPHTGNPAFVDKWGKRGSWNIPTPALTTA